MFKKIVNVFQSLTIFAKCSILDLWQGSEYASELQEQQCLFKISLLFMKILRRFKKSTSSVSTLYSAATKTMKYKYFLILAKIEYN